MKNLMTKIRSNKFARKAAVLGVTALAVIDSASAALPAEVTTALSDGKADGVTLAGGALVIVIAVSAFKLMRRGV